MPIAMPRFMSRFGRTVESIVVQHHAWYPIAAKSTARTGMRPLARRMRVATAMVLAIVALAAGADYSFCKDMPRSKGVSDGC